MDLRCPNCRTRYAIHTGGNAAADLRVRCPKCKTVFPVSSARTVEVEDPGREPGNAAPETPEPAVSRPRAAVASARQKPITDPALARRMARAMISELLLNEAPEGVSGDDGILRRLGPAIAAAYEVYVQRVSPDLPSGTVIFRDAVNDILGRGRSVL